MVGEGVTFEQGAAMMLKGLTVHYLIRRTYRVKKGDTVLLQDAAQAQRDPESRAITGSGILLPQ